MPDERLALCDIDGTLIDQSYQFTDPAIHKAVADIQGAGWVVGLSSDTPYEGMIRYKDMLGMHGPIIAEKGSVVEWDGSLSYDVEEAAIFASSYKRIKEALGRSDVVVWEGNPVKVITDGIRIGRAGDVVVLMNNLRRCSLGLFPRLVNEDGEMVIDTDLTTQIVEQARTLYPDIPNLGEDLSHDYGLLILAKDSVSKRTGSQKLLDLCGLEGRFAMVGNSFADYVGDDIAKHYAVNNATDEFKAVADYVAYTPVTGGVVEIFRGFQTAD